MPQSSKLPLYATKFPPHATKLHSMPLNSNYVVGLNFDSVRICSPYLKNRKGTGTSIRHKKAKRLVAHGTPRLWNLRRLVIFITVDSYTLT